MQQHTHLLTKGAIQMLSNPIELWCVMDGESACSASGHKVLTELIAQVLSPSIRAQDFDGAAVVLCACPHLEPLVG